MSKRKRFLYILSLITLALTYQFIDVGMMRRYCCCYIWRLMLKLAFAQPQDGYIGYYCLQYLMYKCVRISAALTLSSQRAALFREKLATVAIATYSRALTDAT